MAGKRRASGKTPRQIGSLDPTSSFRETASQARRRQQRIAEPLQARNMRRTYLWRRIAAVAALFVLLAMVGTAVAGFMYVRGVDSDMQSQAKKVSPGLKSALDAAPRQKADPFYMLLLGADMRPGEKVARSDTLILVRVDPKQQRISLISIPRDTRAEIPGHKTQKINGAMQIGGPPLVIKTVKELTGLPISHYIQVNFWGFKEIVDAVGGVNVDVPERIVDIKAANHDKTAYIVEKGYQKLDGKHALTFVRSRHFAEGDYIRMKNQQTFLKAVAKQVLAERNPFTINAIIRAAVRNTVTDMTASEIVGLATDFNGMKLEDMESMTMPSEPKYIDGVAWVILDKPKMRTLIDKLASGQKIVPSAATTGSAEVTLASTSVQPNQISVSVRNGIGRAGVANQASQVLGGAGAWIKETGNANKFVYPETLVVYKSNQAKAQVVRDLLGQGRVIKSRGMYSFKSDVLVIIGKDWAGVAGAGHQTQYRMD
jgi:LCP family protein required for cell wall assembly